MAIATFLLLIVILAAATPQGRTAVRTALFIPQVLPGIPVKPQEWFTRPPIRGRVIYPLAEGEGAADLFRPAGQGKHAATLFFLGVNPGGCEDPRVTAFASALARSGLVVMLPCSESMIQKRIDAGELDNLVRAFQYLSTLEFVDPDRMGVGGFCVGSSLVAVAAADERIRDRVRFVNLFGGYYDAADLVKAVVTRTRFYDGQSRSWTPDPLSIEVVTHHLVEGVANENERTLLRQLFSEGRMLASSDLSGLHPEARAVYELLSGPDLDAADELVKGLSRNTQEHLRRISPSAHVHELKARILAMHDREDELIPSEESRRLVEALGSDSDVYYTEFSFFQHVDPTRRVNPFVFVKESIKLFLHVYNIMREVS
ncbi:MAG: hypothetical protein HY704_04335 [Gemmatimonadetes bacterium]|nr:hypothetical protein [Gemmatimonadota bacterium]